MANIFDGWDERIVTLCFAVAMLGAWQIGRWMGHKLLVKGSSKPSKFDNASKAFAGLLIAFAFGASIVKHDQRRLAVVADSNAIDDFLHTHATLLKEPTRSELRSVIEQYARLRLDLMRRKIDQAAMETALAKFDQMYGQMAELVGRAVREGIPVAVSLTNALNALTINQAPRLKRDQRPGTCKRSDASLGQCARDHVLIGREQGSIDNLEITGLVSIVVLVIFDLNGPNSGLIRVSQEPITRELSSMHSDHRYFDCFDLSK